MKEAFLSIDESVQKQKIVSSHMYVCMSHGSKSVNALVQLVQVEFKRWGFSLRCTETLYSTKVVDAAELALV